MAGFPIVELETMVYVQGEGYGVVFFGAGPAPRFGDLNDDGQVNGSDLGLMLANWGNPGIGDIDEDGVVSGGDLGALLAAWTN